MNIIKLPPASLAHLPTRNPNVMDPYEFDKLVHNITEYGFLQPVLAVKDGARYVLIDGVHRTKAAVQAGLSEIPVVVARSMEHAEILRIAMNKLRGQLDLTEVGRQFATLADMGFTAEQLTDTGFQDWEISALMDAVQDLTDVDLSGADTEPPKSKTKAFTLTFHFDTESARAGVKEALAELGDGNMLTGLMAALQRR